MRKIAKIFFATVAMLAAGSVYKADASLAPLPQPFRGSIQQLKFDSATLPPMAFTLFCLKYTAECKPRKQPVFRSSRVNLDIKRWEELNQVNRSVNAKIRPEANTAGLAGEKWLLHPASGDCNDYAVSKRHDLIAKGWSERAVLLSEVVTAWGEHHLVVVVRTSSGDLVLDNLTGTIVPWSRKAYRWVRIQTPKNPSYWASIADRNV